MLSLDAPIKLGYLSPRMKPDTTSPVPVKLAFLVSRNLSDCRNPRYIARFGSWIFAEGRTLSEVRTQLTQKLGHIVQPEFLVMAE